MGGPRVSCVYARLLCGILPLLAIAATSFADAVHFEIDGTSGNNTLFAISSFIENNVNRADDGGLYAELIQNRAFQEATSYLTIPGWKKIGSASLYQDPDTPLEALKRSLEIYISANSSRLPGERAGVNNTGWFGIPIKQQPYKASFWAKRDELSRLSGDVQLSLASLTTNQTYATASFDTAHITTEWKQFTAILHPTEDAPDSNNVLSLTLEVSPDHDQYAWFNLISLFPPTYKDRENGLRPDLAQVLADLKPKHIRIPGGSNLQGGDISSRFNWTLSLGPVEQRPGRVGYWVGYQTEGLGLKELLDMCEDFGAPPVLGIYDGYAADDESVPNTHQLDKYIESAVDELHFVLGDPITNKWGRLRAQLGHPEPYKVEFIEIGNEDFTSTTYGYRWQRFYDAMKAAYPHINFIASSSIDKVQVPAVDVHDFSGPDFFYGTFSRYDNWPRNGTMIWELETAVINTNSLDPFGTPDTRLKTPTLQGSIAEAVFLMGMQRNGDLVLGASYAPYLANNYSTQWTPNLINFNVSHVALSTSYHVHRMISHARAEKTHPVNSTANLGPLYWVATSTNSSSSVSDSSSASTLRTYYFQIANIEQDDIPITGIIRRATTTTTTSSSSSMANSNSNSTKDTQPTQNKTRTTLTLEAESTILAASPDEAYNITNDLETPNAVVPTTQPIDATLIISAGVDNNATFSASASRDTIEDVDVDGVPVDVVFKFTVPGRSFGVYRFTLFTLSR